MSVFESTVAACCVTFCGLYVFFGGMVSEAAPIPSSQTAANISQYNNEQTLALSEALSANHIQPPK
jgi:hypothetical protein